MNNAIQYILDRLTSPVFSRELNSIYVLLHTMPQSDIELLKDILQKEEWLYDLDAMENIVTHIEEECRQYHGYPHNKSIEELLAGISEEANVFELKKRFYYQEYDVQIRIIKAMLYVDRRWVYDNIEKVWNNNLLEDIQQLWQEYDDYRCACLVVKYSPEEYLLQNLQKLEMHDIYRAICTRLWNNSNFTIKEHLFKDKWDYMIFRKQIDLPIHNGEEVLCELFSYVKDAIENSEKYATEVCKTFNALTSDFFMMSAKVIDEVRDFLWIMGDLGLVDELLFFYNWDKDVQYELFQAIINKYGVSGDLTTKECWLMYCDLAKQLLPKHLNAPINK